MDVHDISGVEIKANGARSELDLTQKADKMLKHIVEASISKNADLRGFRNRILTKTSPTSVQSLNGFIHNQFQIPTADELRAGWDCSIPIFIAAFGPV